MKKKILLIVVVILAVGGSAGAYFALKNDAEESSTTSSTTTTSDTSTKNTPTQSPKAQKACDILTKNVAEKALGVPASGNIANTSTVNETDHVKTSTCTYTINGETSVLLMRAAKDAEGSAHDKEQFGPNKPVNALDVNGYGDSAYWDADFRQLNVLKGNTWYIITNGSTQPTERTLDQAKKLANLLKPTL